MTVDLDEIYRKMTPERIPWNIETPPSTLVDLVESGKVLPCRAVDLGCGLGNYAVYLAGMGFTVTGIDISPTAISLAIENARKKGVSCKFIVADVLGDLGTVIRDRFDFAYDWELLHHVYPEERRRYLENVVSLLESGGKYFSLCFSESDPQFGGTGKYRETPLGTVLYFSSLEELRDLFSPCFRILDLKTITVTGKFGPHIANYAFMEKK